MVVTEEAAPRDGVVIGAYVSPEVKSAVQRLAARNGRTVSAELRALVKQHLSRQEEPSRDGSLSSR